MFDRIKHSFWVYDSWELALMNMLSQIDIFSWYTNKQLYSLSQKFTLYNYNIWDVIVKQWDNPWIIWLVQEWIIQVIHHKDNKKTILWEIRSWEIYAEMSYFNNKTSMADLIAKTTVISWEICIRDFEVFLEIYPELSSKIKRIIEKREKLNQGFI